MTTRNSQEIRQEWVCVMGEPLGALFHELWQEVATIYLIWNQFYCLYCDKPSRIDLLNQAAPVFFGVVQNSILEGTLLHITRLTDPPCSAGKANLTIQRLHSMIGDAPVAQRVEELTKRAVDASEFCRDWRNRRIAHRDLNLTLDPHATPLKEANRKKIESAIGAIEEVLNAVSGHYRRSTSYFDKPTEPGDAFSLLCVIDDGLRARKERPDRWRAEDYRPRNL